MPLWFACEFCRRPISNQKSSLCGICQRRYKPAPAVDVDQDCPDETDARHYLHDEPEGRYDRWLEECGKIGHGICLKAGSEECDFECPFSY